MPRVGFEPTIPALERAKTVHASDDEATVIGPNFCLYRTNLTTILHLLERKMQRRYAEIK
jgi:hypothetical protein